MYGSGVILGAGIYVLVGKAAGAAGNTVWISFAIGAVLVTFTGLSYAELSAMYPRSAAEFVYVKNAFKSDFLAFMVGWLIVFMSVVSSSAISIGFGGYFAGLFGGTIRLPAVMLIITLSLVNFYGIRESSWMNIVFTLIEAGGLLFIIFAGFTFAQARPVNYLESPFGIYGILTAVPLVFFAYIGFDNIVNIAEETKNPSKVLPRAVLISILITAILYLFVALATVRIMDWTQLAASAAPLADVAVVGFGTNAAILLSAIALFATANTVLIALITGSRITYGIAQQGSLPSILSSIHSRTKTPAAAILVIMTSSIAFTFAGDLVTIANITVLAVVIIFAFVNASLLILRYKAPNVERPFRVPMNIGRFPVLPFLGLVTSIAGAILFEPPVLVVGVIVISVGAFVYMLYTSTSRRNTLTQKDQ
jgi:APA family basic amino acid/polyamine antiporter